MLVELLVESRMQELAIAKAMSGRRAELHAMRQVERLEAALSRARARVAMTQKPMAA